jgi:hypothetical protein
MQRKLAAQLIIAALFTTPAAAGQYIEDEPDYSPPVEEVRPLGGNYYDWGNGSGQGWQNYSGGHSCYTSTVNGYSVTNCN